MSEYTLNFDSLDDFLNSVQKRLDYLMLWWIQQLESRDSTPVIISDVFRYSLISSGKRLRPALVYLFSRLNPPQQTSELIFPSAYSDCFALAVELIHTYSLIHDDLPAMDNDDFRRFKPTVHRQYSEDIAILAGDAMLTEAFVVISDQRFKLSETQISVAIKVLAEAISSSGMIAGQIYDMNPRLLDNQNYTELKKIQLINSLKTARLLKASGELGMIAAGTHSCNKFLTEAQYYLNRLGVFYQLCDDIAGELKSTDELGKTARIDRRNQKLTNISILGINKALTLALSEATALSGASFSQEPLLNELIWYIAKHSGVC